MQPTQILLFCIQILQIALRYASAIQFSEGTAVSCPNGWNCSISKYEYNVKNLNTTAQFHIRLTVSMDSLVVYCRDIQLNDMETILPSLRMAEYNSVHIWECPSSGSFTVGRTLRTLGVAKCNTFHLKCTYEENTTAHQYLENLPEITTLNVNIKTKGRISADIISDKSLSNLSELYISSNVCELPVDIFVNLENMKRLEINNNLHTLPNGIFRNCKQLTLLVLSYNKLQNLHKEVFNGADALTDLFLASNDIEYLAGDVFEQLINVQNIDLTYNQIKLLPADLFRHNKNIIAVEMNRNMVDIPSLPSALLANLKELTRVSFKCGLVSLPGDLLANSSAITEVWLSNNNLKTIPAELFMSQTVLQTVNLSNNELRHLPDSIFRYNVLMTRLYINSNKLENISTYHSAHFGNPDPKLLCHATYCVQCTIRRGKSAIKQRPTNLGTCDYSFEYS